MKFEQACRFRASGGYRITAHTNNITEDNTRHMAVFSDTMNTLFERGGDSVMTLAIQEYDAMLTVSTMRSDVGGRPAIFSNTFFIPLEDYNWLMEKNPSIILTIPDDVFQVMEIAGLEHLNPVEINENMDPLLYLEDVRNDYQLDKERYATLLTGAVRALTGGGSLCIRANADPYLSMDIVRDMVFCVAKGIIPSLRGQLTWSSALDTRQKVCLNNGGARIGSASMLSFPAYADGTADIGNVDPMTQRVFDAIAGASDEERDRMLDAMQNWLDNLLGPGGRPDFYLYVMSWYIATGYPLSSQEAQSLLQILTNSAGIAEIKEEAREEVTMDLLRYCGDGSEDPALTELLGKLYEKSVAESKTAMITVVKEAVLRLPAKEQFQITRYLMDKAADPLITSKAADRLAEYAASGSALPMDQGAEILAWCEKKKLTSVQIKKLCGDYIRQLPVPEQINLADRITRDLLSVNPQNRELDCFLLNSLVTDMMDPVFSAAGTALSDDAVSNLVRLWTRLDKWNPEEDKLQETITNYIYSKKLHTMSNLWEQTDYLQWMEKNVPNLFKQIEDKIHRNPADKEMWDTFTVSRYLRKGMTLNELVDASVYNPVRDMRSGFERNFVYYWNEQMKEDIQKIEGFAWRYDWVFSVQDKLKVVMKHCSRESCYSIFAETVRLFWQTLRYSEVIRDIDEWIRNGKERNALERLSVKDRFNNQAILDTIEKKLGIRKLWESLMAGLNSDSKAVNCRYFIQVMLAENSSFNVPEKQDIASVMNYMAGEIYLITGGLVAWDLLVMGNTVYNEDGSRQFQASKLAEAINAITAASDPAILRVAAESSQILNNENAKDLLKELRGVARSSEPIALLLEELKKNGSAGGSRGLFGLNKESMQEGVAGLFGKHK